MGIVLALAYTKEVVLEGETYNLAAPALGFLICPCAMAQTFVEVVSMDLAKLKISEDEILVALGRSAAPRVEKLSKLYIDLHLFFIHTFNQAPTCCSIPLFFGRYSRCQGDVWQYSHLASSG